MSQRRLKNHLWFRTFGPVPKVPCHWCQVELSFNEATVDHEPPRSLGGTRETTVIACRDCNRERNFLEQKKGWFMISKEGRKVNSKYLFAVKQPTYDEGWPGLVVCITSQAYWSQNHVISDCHLSGKIEVPEQFSEEMESTFSFQGTEQEAIRLLTQAGFRHSPEMQKFIESCDP